MAAPVAGKILGEVLPYLELQQDNEETKVESKNVTVPDITYKTLAEAEKILKEYDLQIKYDGNIETKEKENIIIKEQIPSSGITINTGSSINVSF